jgi:hypothetical protein
VDLSLRFEDNGTAHDDILFRLNGRVWVTDSYYLALDGGILPNDSDSTKVRLVLKRLLEQWVAALESLNEGCTIYLPFAFEDQHTKWLSCTQSGDLIELHAGRARVEGWSFYPSAVQDHVSQLSDFRADGEPVYEPREAVIHAVRLSIEHAS